MRWQLKIFDKQYKEMISSSYLNIERPNPEQYTPAQWFALCAQTAVGILNEQNKMSKRKPQETQEEQASAELFDKADPSEAISFFLKGLTSHPAFNVQELDLTLEDAFSEYLKILPKLKERNFSAMSPEQKGLLVTELSQQSAQADAPAAKFNARQKSANTLLASQIAVIRNLENKIKEAGQDPQKLTEVRKLQKGFMDLLSQFQIPEIGRIELNVKSTKNAVKLWTIRFPEEFIPARYLCPVSGEIMTTPVVDWGKILGDLDYLSAEAISACGEEGHPSALTVVAKAAFESLRERLKTPSPAQQSSLFCGDENLKNEIDSFVAKAEHLATKYPTQYSKAYSKYRGFLEDANCSLEVFQQKLTDAVEAKKKNKESATTLYMPAPNEESAAPKPSLGADAASVEEAMINPDYVPGPGTKLSQ